MAPECGGRLRTQANCSTTMNARSSPRRSSVRVITGVSLPARDCRRPRTAPRRPASQIGSRPAPGRGRRAVALPRDPARSVLIAAASAAASRSGTSRPVPRSSTTAPMPPARVATTGVARTRAPRARCWAARRRCRCRRGRTARRPTSAAASRLATSSCGRLPRNRTRSATPSRGGAGAKLQLEVARRRRWRATALPGSTSGSASMRYSKPFLRTRRPAATMSGASPERAERARRRARAPASGLKRPTSTPYGTTSIALGRRAKRGRAAARSSLHAVMAPARRNTARASAPAGALRSATKTSEPCRLTTSGRPGRGRSGKRAAGHDPMSVHHRRARASRDAQGLEPARCARERRRDPRRPPHLTSARNPAA